MTHFDLCILGSGSGNSIVDAQFDDLSVAIVEKGTFGGTCLNVGCIPTKMFVYPADLAVSPAQAGQLGVDLRLQDVDWIAIRDRIFGRIDPIARKGRDYRRHGANVTLFEEHAHFVGERRLELADGTIITADRFVIAAGGRPTIPDLPGLEQVDFHTSDSVMRLERLPASMIIVGGGYVAAEFAHVFSAYGTRVHVLARGDVLLSREDREVSELFTASLARRVDVLRKAEVRQLSPSADGIRASLLQDGEPLELTAEVLLIATGRTPNADTLAPEAAGVEVDAHGRITVDAFQRTSADGIFALGDISSTQPLKHVANYEARVVQHNLLHPDAMIEADLDPVPHAVFSDPQVASAGLTEEQAREQGQAYRVGRHRYGDTAYGWAMEDAEHFVKVLVDPDTGLLLGAHLVGPQASSLIQPLVQAMSFGQRAEDVARGQYWIHPAMAEVVENALLAAV